MLRKCLSEAYRICAIAGLLALPAAASAQAPVVSVAGTARIWWYRDYSPYTNTNYATVRINGAVAGSVQPYGGRLYSDVAPGRYHLTADSIGEDVNQAADVDLAPGQEAYVKILNLGSWFVPSFESTQRDTYYLRLMPPDTARAEIARLPY
jgi:hypothetical protein